MGCYSCGGNPSTFCRECVQSKDTWIAPVDTLPDVFMGDFDHLYRTPDGNLYALSPDRLNWIQVNGSGGNPVRYTAGNGIEISNRNVITNTQPNVTQNLSINGRTISITNGNSITLPEDRDTVYNDTELKRRVQAVESKTDNFVSGVNVSREGNKVKLTYTFVNGAPKEVEFEDKDTITLAYDDTALKARVKALEDRPDRDTVYDDRALRDRVTALENKSDRDNQTLSVDPNTRSLSLSGGNSVTLPSDKQTLTKEGNRLILSNGGGEVVIPTATPYDDSSVVNRLNLLEAKGDKDSQTLSLDNSSRVLTISNGNSVTIPSDKQTISRQGNKLVLSNGGGEIDLPQGNNAVPYDDSNVRARLTTLEDKVDKDSQTLSLDTNTRVLTISNGNSVTIPSDKQTITKQGNRLVLSNGGGEIELPQPNSAVAYDDSDLRNRVGALETKPDKDTVYNDSDVKRRLTELESRTDNFVTGVTASREGNKVRLTYNFVSGQPKNVEFDDKDTIGVAYDDTAIRNRLQTLESKPSPTLSLSGNTLSLTNGGSVELPSQNSSVYRATKGKINNNVTYKSNIVNGDDIKAGDIVHDVDSTGTTPKDIYYKVTSVSGNTVNVEKLGERNIPVGTSYDDSSLRNRVQALESKADRDNQTLTFNEGTRSLSLSGGNSITIPNDKQTLSKSGNKLVLSNGGGEVDIPTATPYDDSDVKRRLGVLESRTDNDRQTLSLSGRTLSISNGNNVTIPDDKQTLSIEGNRITLSGNGGSIELPNNSSVFRLSKGDIQGGSVGFTTTIRKDTLMNPDGVKEGDIIQDYWSGTTSANQEYWKVTSVSGDNVSIQNIGRRDLPVSRQSLSINGNRLTLSDNGGSVDLPATSPSYVATKGKINNNATYKSNLMYSGDVKVGDIVRDIDTTGTTPKEVYYTISSVNGNTVNMAKLGEKDIPQPNISGYVTIQQYNELKDALTKLLEDLKNSGAWQQTGSNIFAGRLYADRHIATGNINLFSNGTDTASFIRTNNTSTENDLAGGVG